MSIKAADRDIGWNLAPGQCGRLTTGADGVVTASQISAGSDKAGANVRIDVTEQTDNKVQWQSTFARLSVGGEFVVGGEIYEVLSITVKPVNAEPPTGNSVEPGANCAGGSSYVSVRDTKRRAFDNDQDVMILPATANIGVRVGEGPCVMGVSFVSMQDKRSVANLEWHEVSREPWKTCDKWKSTSGSFGVNDILDMHEYGRFRIKAIVPQTENHTDWIVLVRD